MLFLENNLFEHLFPKCQPSPMWVRQATEDSADWRCSWEMPSPPYSPSCFSRKAGGQPATKHCPAPGRPLFRRCQSVQSGPARAPCSVFPEMGKRLESNHWAAGSCVLVLLPCPPAQPLCLGRSSKHSKSLMSLSGLDPEVLTIFHILQNLKEMLKDYINFKKSVLLLLKKNLETNLSAINKCS